MKGSLLLILLLCGLSFAVQAKYFTYERPGIKCDNIKSLSTFGRKAVKPQFVFAEGAFHPITSNVYPYYTPHSIECNSKLCFKPGANKPLGSLWQTTIHQSSIAFNKIDNNYFSFNTDKYIQQAQMGSFKNCENCTLKAIRPYDLKSTFRWQGLQKPVFSFEKM